MGKWITECDICGLEVENGEITKDHKCLSLNEQVAKAKEWKKTKKGWQEPKYKTSDRDWETKLDEKKDSELKR